MSEKIIDEIYKFAQEILNDEEIDNEQIINKFEGLYKEYNYLKREEKYLKPPGDLDSPFFAYGMFKPSQLAYPKIRDCVESYREGYAKRKLFERDGIPFLDDEPFSDNGRSTKGFVIKFKDGKAETAYDRIRKFEPRAYYKWEKIDIEDDGKAWALVGRSPSRSNPKVIESGIYDAGKDVYFTTVLGMITNEMKSCIGLKTEYPFFNLLKNYLLLWAAIERFLSLKYGEGVKSSNNKELSDEPVFANSLKKYVSEERKVCRTDNLETVKLNPNNPKNAIQYYYSVRSNVVHRGKIARPEDEETLRKSLLELLNIFQDILEYEFADLHFNNRVSVNVVEENRKESFN